MHGVSGEDQREERSPSYFNAEEAAIVVNYIDKLLNAKKVGKKVVINPDRDHTVRDLKSLKTRHLHYKSHLATNIELFPPSPRKYCPIMFQCTEKIVLLGQKA